MKRCQKVNPNNDPQRQAKRKKIRREGTGRRETRGEGGRTVTFGDEPYVRGLKDMTELFLVQYYSDIQNEAVFHFH